MRLCACVFHRAGLSPPPLWCRGVERAESAEAATCSAVKGSSQISRASVAAGGRTRLRFPATSSDATHRCARAKRAGRKSAEHEALAQPSPAMTERRPARRACCRALALLTSATHPGRGHTKVKVRHDCRVSSDPGALPFPQPFVGKEPRALLHAQRWVAAASRVSSLAPSSRACISPTPEGLDWRGWKPGEEGGPGKEGEIFANVEST